MLVKMEIYFDGEYWCARGIGEDIFTQGKSLDELMENIKEAVEVHFGDVKEEIKIITISEMEITKPQMKNAVLELPA